MIGNHAGNHGFADRHRANADARVVAAFGRNFGVAAVAVDSAPRRQDRRGRLDRKARDQRLSGRNAAQNAAGIVGQEDRLAVVAHAHLVAVFLAVEFGGAEARADFDALDGIDTISAARDRRRACRRSARRDPPARLRRQSRSPRRWTSRACARHQGNLRRRPLSPRPGKKRNCARPRPSPSAPDRSGAAPSAPARRAP